MDRRIILLGLAMLFCFAVAEALEIKSGASEDLTIFLQNATTGAPIEGSTCVIDVWQPNKTKILDDGAMTELGEGFYYFTTNTSWTAPGDYRVLAKCTVGASNFYSAMMFSVVATTVTEWFETINQTTSNTYNYLQNTLYPAVDQVESKLDDVLNNQSNLWSKLIEIQGNVTSNYNEIINVQSQLTDVNASVMAELADHKNRLIAINTTVNNILENITQAVNPKLDQLQTDIDLIKGYTDTLETGQAQILANLSAVQSVINTINSNTDQIEGYIDSLEDLLNCNSSTDTPLCSKLDTINTTVNTINTNTDSLEAGQTTITNYVDTLETGQNTILSNIAELKSYLNCSSMPASSICWRLDLIQSYTDTLETGQQAIMNYTDTLETNQTQILNQLNTIENYVDTVEAGIADLDSDIQTLSTATGTRFDAIDSNLTAIYSTVQSILSNQTAINASQTILLNQILTLTTQSNSTVNWIELYLNGTITQYLADINETVHATYNLLVALNSTISSIYSDTQDILTKWGAYNATSIMDILDSMDTQLDTIQSSSNSTEVLNAISALESIVNSTRDELGFEGKSLTAYEYFVQLDSMLVNINATILNKIEFEANRTIAEIQSAIQSNTTAVIAEINSNEAKLDSILTKWGNYSAADIISNVTANRNKLIDLENWLNAFNDTEAQRHNVSQSLINDILAWLGIFNQTEAQRHNLTQTQINNLFDEVNDTEGLCNQIITVLGYTGINSTVYDDLVALYNQNAQIIALAQQINLTTEQINITTKQTQEIVEDINETVTAIYNYLQNTLYPAVDQVESKLDDVLNNQSNLWSKLIEIQGNVTSNYNEIINVQSQLTDVNASVMAELADHKNRLIAINTTVNNILENITQAVNPKLDLIQSDLSVVASDISIIKIRTDCTNTTVADSLCSRINLIQGYTDTVEAGIADLDSDIQTLSTATGTRFDAIDSNLTAIYSDTQSIISSGISLDASTNATLNEILSILTLTNLTVNWIELYLNGTITSYLENINKTVADINATVAAAYSLLAQLNSTINSAYTDTQNILAKWGSYSMQDIYDKLDEIHSDVNNLNLSGANLTVDNTDVMNAISALESIVNSTRDELGFEGKSLTAYEYFVQLDSMLVNINATILNKIEFEANRTIAEIQSAIQSNTTAVIAEINSNEAKLDSILTKWGNYSAADIISNVTANRNKLIDLENWLNAFNDTEAQRHNLTKGLINDVLTWFGVLNQSETERHNLTQSKIDQVYTLLNQTYDNSNSIISVLGYSGKNSTVYSDLIALYNQNNQIIELAQEINLTSHQNYNILFTLNETISLVYSDTQDILAKWGSYNSSSIIDQLNIMDAKLDTIEYQTDTLEAGQSAVISALDDLEIILNATRDELGFEGKSLTAYQYFVQMESGLFAVNTSLWTKIQTEHLATVQEIKTAISSNTTAIINEVNDNENMLNSIVTKWENVTASAILSNITEIRNQVITLQSWLNLFNETELQRHNESQNMLNNIWTWLGLFNQTESTRHNVTQTQLLEVLADADNIINLSNEIIAQLGYLGINISLHDDILGIMDLIAILTASVGALSDMDYIELSTGANAFALPKQPSNISIEFVTLNITGKFTRVDYYNAALDQWQVYNPNATFGNTLDTLSIYKVYWIYATENCTWYIK